MSYRYEIRLSGEGGQGLVLAGKILAEAAAIYDNKNALVEHEQWRNLNFPLFQNYPNPFNSETIIQYHVPVKSNVSLKIFNAIGQEVQTLVDDEILPGNHLIHWNGKNYDDIEMSAGVYLYQICIDGFYYTKKMLLLR